jgi:hypothetical protein
MNAKQWNGTAFCDGLCSDTPHTAFHSTMYALAFNAVDDDHAEAAWEYTRSRINPPFYTSSTPPSASSSAVVDASFTQRVPAPPWPPPGPSSGLGLPCGVHPSQFAVEALYTKTSDLGASALAVLTSSATNSWVNMLKQGATMTMEMWTPEEKPNLTWSHPWASSPAFLIAWYLFGIRPTSPVRCPFTSVCVCVCGGGGGGMWSVLVCTLACVVDIS